MQLQESTLQPRDAPGTTCKAVLGGARSSWGTVGTARGARQRLLGGEAARTWGLEPRTLSPAAWVGREPGNGWGHQDGVQAGRAQGAARWARRVSSGSEGSPSQPQKNQNVA